MSRFVLIPDDHNLRMLVPDNPNLQSMQITVPNGLMSKAPKLYTQYRKQFKNLKNKVSSKRNLRKVLRCLQKKNVTVDDLGQAVHNGHVLKGIIFNKAVQYAAEGIKKSKYFEFNNLL